MHRMLDVREAEVRSAHAARANIAFARYKQGNMTRREFAAELAEAERERLDRMGDAIRSYLKAQ